MYDNYVDPISYIEKDWISEQYSGGCFATIIGPDDGSNPNDYEYLRKPIDDDDNRILISCSESSTKFYGYIEGAARSGKLTAETIISSLSV